jgi:hypothetical protein
MGKMTQLGVWLASMVQPLVGKVLLALGFQVVTLTGVVVAIDQVKGLFLSHIGQVPAAGFQLALLAGVGEAFGMIFGAITFRLAMWQIQNATRILGSSSGG